MQNVSGETFDAVSVRKSLSKLSDFLSVTASPYRVLHQAQGDKQKKLAAVAIMEYSVRRLENSIPFAAVSLVQS